MGKTRLVQEFYRRLISEHDPERYWPDAALFHGNNLRVAPERRDDPAVRRTLPGSSSASDACHSSGGDFGSPIRRTVTPPGSI